MRAYAGSHLDEPFYFSIHMHILYGALFPAARLPLPLSWQGMSKWPAWSKRQVVELEMEKMATAWHTCRQVPAAGLNVKCNALVGGGCVSFQPVNHP